MNVFGALFGQSIEEVREKLKPSLTSQLSLRSYSTFSFQHTWKLPEGFSKSTFHD